MVAENNKALTQPDGTGPVTTKALCQPRAIRRNPGGCRQDDGQLSRPSWYRAVHSGRHEYCKLQLSLFLFACFKDTKIKILSLFTHPHIFWKPYDLSFYVTQNELFIECPSCSFLYNKSEWWRYQARFWISICSSQTDRLGRNTACKFDELVLIWCLTAPDLHLLSLYGRKQLRHSAKLFTSYLRF